MMEHLLGYSGIAGSRSLCSQCHKEAVVQSSVQYPEYIVIDFIRLRNFVEVNLRKVW